MSEIEHLIAEQAKTIETLTAKVEELENHSKEIFDMALVWKKSYSDLESKYRREMGNAQKTIEALEDELTEFKDRILKD